MSFRVQLHEEVASTNDLVKAALRAGEPEGLAVHACRQNGGYGRQGRSWASPEGGLYLSLLLRPEAPLSRLPTLSLVVGLAVREAIASAVAPEQAARVQVKWPNDVVHAADGAQVSKLCGISLERVGEGVCVGIGVNVLPPAEREAVAGKNRPCYLAELGAREPSVDAMREAVLAAFAPRYARWCAEGLAPFLEDYAGHALLTGRTVAVEDLEGNVLARGRAEGIDDAGRLIVVDEATGQRAALSSGEVHIAAIGELF